MGIIDCGLGPWVPRLSTRASEPLFTRVVYHIFFSGGFFSVVFVGSFFNGSEPVLTPVLCHICQGSSLPRGTCNNTDGQQGFISPPLPEDCSKLICSETYNITFTVNWDRLWINSSFDYEWYFLEKKGLQHFMLIFSFHLFWSNVAPLWKTLISWNVELYFALVNSLEGLYNVHSKTVKPHHSKILARS